MSDRTSDEDPPAMSDPPEPAPEADALEQARAVGEDAELDDRR